MIRIVIAVVLIVLLGFYGIIFFSADLGPGESWFSRPAVAFSFFRLCLPLSRGLSFRNGR